MNALLSQDHLDAIRAIIERVANNEHNMTAIAGYGDSSYLYCIFECGGCEIGDTDYRHAPDCPVTLARTLLASASAPTNDHASQ